MAITIMPQQESMGGALGTGLGAGLSSGIGTLVDMKLQAMQKRQQQKSTMEGLQGLGYSPEQSAQLASLDPQILNTVIKEGLAGPSRSAFEGAITGMPGMQQQPPAGIESLQTEMPSQGAPVTAGMDEPIGMPGPGMEAPPTPIPTAKEIKPEVFTGKEIPKAKKASEATRLSGDIDRMKTALSSGTLNPKHFGQLARLITQKEDTLAKLIVSEKKEKADQKRFKKKQENDDRSFELASKKHLDTMGLKKQQIEIQEQNRLDRKYDPFLDALGKKAEGSLKDKARFAEMARINEEGDLGSNAFNTMVDALEHGLFGLGINLTSLQTADAQSMKKLSKDFVKNIKEIIGTSRITQAEILLYLSTIPNLQQNPEARARIIKTNEIFADMPVKKYKIASDILKKNNGNYPKNFKEKVFEKMEPSLRDLENRIKGVVKEARENPKLAKKQKEFEERGVLGDILGSLGRTAAREGGSLIKDMFTNPFKPFFT